MIGVVLLQSQFHSKKLSVKKEERKDRRTLDRDGEHIGPPEAAQVELSSFLYGITTGGLARTLYILSDVAGT